MSTNPDTAPLNPLPWIVWVLALPVFAMEAAVSLGASGLVGGQGGLDWRFQAMERFAFFPGFIQGAWERGQIIPDEPWRLVTYVLVHGSFTNALFAVVILLALGKMVGEIFRWWAVAAVWLGAAVVGVLVYTVAVPGNSIPVIGAFPADYGLIGAFTYLIWMRLAGTGSSQFRAFTLIGMLLLVQLLFGLLFGGGFYWIAEVAGFVTGFLLSFVVSPGGWGRLMARLRRR